MGPGKKNIFRGELLASGRVHGQDICIVTKGRPAGEPRCWSRDASGVPVTTRPRPGRGFPAKSAAGSDQGCSCGEGAGARGWKLWRPSRGFFWKFVQAIFWLSLPLKKVQRYNKIRDSYQLICVKIKTCLKQNCNICMVCDWWPGIWHSDVDAQLECTVQPQQMIIPDPTQSHYKGEGEYMAKDIPRNHCTNTKYDQFCILYDTEILSHIPFLYTLKIIKTIVNLV